MVSVFWVFSKRLLLWLRLIVMCCQMLRYRECFSFLYCISFHLKEICCFKICYKAAYTETRFIYRLLYYWSGSPSHKIAPCRASTDVRETIWFSNACVLLRNNQIRFTLIIQFLMCKKSWWIAFREFLKFLIMLKFLSRFSSLSRKIWDAIFMITLYVA